MTFEIPNDVRFIIDSLEQNGFEGYLVGGCIRDMLLNKAPKDYDITTSATPDKVCDIFKKTIPTGLKHGTVTVLLNNIPYEVTTFRTEGEYKDNRRPEEVIFVTDIRDDLSRRDFTINSFAYNPKSGLVDFFNGQEDLDNKLIRAVGDANKRFCEDALRMMRAVRFSSQLDFSIEEKTLEAIKTNSHLIKNISQERIRDELVKILLSSNPRKGFDTLYETGLLSYILPELNKCFGMKQYTPYHFEDVYNHSLSVLDNTLHSDDLIIRLSALLHDVGKPLCFSFDENGMGHFYNHQIEGEELSKEILTRLRFDNDTINNVSNLIREHMSVMDTPSDSAVKRLINRVGKDNIFKLYTLQRADMSSLKNPEKVLWKMDLIEEKTNSILNQNLPLSVKDLDVNGKDLISLLNIKPGKEIGEILSALLDKVLDDPTLNNKETLLNIVKSNFKE